MKGDICLFDYHQKSHCDTISIGPEGMINWVLQLNISQLESSFNRFLESTSKKTSCSQEIVGKCLQELGSSDRTVRPVKCDASYTIERGNLWNRAHTHSARIWFFRT